MRSLPTAPAMLNLSLAVEVAVLVAALVLRAWLTRAESSLLHVNEPEVRRRAANRERGPVAVALLLDSGEYLGAFLLSATSLVLLIATLATVYLAASNLTHLERALCHVGLVAVIVVASDLVPWLYGGLFASRVAYGVGPASLRFTRWLRPLTALLALLLRALHVPAFSAPGHPARFVTAADIQAAADLSEESGTMEPEVGRMLDEVMELSATSVREVMTPRVEIVGVPAEAGAAEMTEAAIDSGFSRLPVYEGDLDNPLGVLFVSDLLARLAAGTEPVTARELARPALLTPEARPISDLLREMRERAMHMALVIGDDGGTEGLVTIEDILEELVGEIEDEHDAPEEDLRVEAPGVLLAEGRVRLSEIEAALDLTFPPTDAETVAGLMAGLLGRMPREGESASFAGVTFRVEERDGQQLRRVHIVRTQEAP